MTWLEKLEAYLNPAPVRRRRQVRRVVEKEDDPLYLGSFVVWVETMREEGDGEQPPAV